VAATIWRATAKARRVTKKNNDFVKEEFLGKQPFVRWRRMRRQLRAALAEEVKRRSTKGAKVQFPCLRLPLRSGKIFGGTSWR
jgi:hypothetical protein